MKQIRTETYAFILWNLDRFAHVYGKAYKGIKSLSNTSVDTQI